MMGGGGPFSTYTNFFSKFFAVLFIFFLNNPLLEFSFFSKNCWRAGGGGEGGEVNIFSRSQNFFQDK